MRAFLAAGGRLLVTLDPMRKQGETNAGVHLFLYSFFHSVWDCSPQSGGATDIGGVVVFSLS